MLCFFCFFALCNNFWKVNNLEKNYPTNASYTKLLFCWYSLLQRQCFLFKWCKFLGCFFCFLINICCGGCKNCLKQPFCCCKVAILGACVLAPLQLPPRRESYHFYLYPITPQRESYHFYLYPITPQRESYHFYLYPAALS